jgi:hypothetical protein
MRNVFRSVLKVLQFAVGGSFAILLVLAIAGTFVALFGGLSGLENVKIVGRKTCGIGAFGFLFGFFALAVSGFGDLLFLSIPASQSNTGSKINTMGPSRSFPMSKKGNVE